MKAADSTMGNIRKSVLLRQRHNIEIPGFKFYVGLANAV